GLHQRRRAAAEEDGRYGSSAYARRDRRDLGGQRAREACLVNWDVRYMAVEVAIRALRQAERPVDVDAERGLLPITALQDKPPRASGTRVPGARALCPRAAAQASPRSSFRRKCEHGHQAKTWGRSRNPYRRAGATRGCRAPQRRTLPRVRRAKRDRARRRTEPCVGQAPARRARAICLPP